MPEKHRYHLKPKIEHLQNLRKLHGYGGEADTFSNETRDSLYGRSEAEKAVKSGQEKGQSKPGGKER